jgi:hypothetical protein
MNKHNTQFIPKFILLIVTALSSGCTQATITAFPTATHSVESSLIQSPIPAPIISTVDATLLNCFPIPSAPTAEIEKVAENWFLSDISQINGRDLYGFVDNLESWIGICKIYQHATQLGEDWTKSPTEIVLRLITQNSYLELYTPNKLTLVAENDENLVAKNNHLIPPVANQNIAIVVIEYSHYNFHAEDRFDFVRENGFWQIRWWGNRWQCINSTNNTVWNTGVIDC